MHPYQPNYYDPWKGRFRRHGARSKYSTLIIDNDGTVDIRVTASKGLDTDLYLYAKGKLVKSARLDGRKERLRYRSCGHRKLRLEVHRYRGYGSWKAQEFLPFDGPGVR